MAKKIIALHGFLGSPKDFSGLKNLAVQAPHIFNTQICPLKKWADRFSKQIPNKTVLLGYSMGGRLALHCLCQNPDKFSAAIIVCAHPGLGSKKLREKRIWSDRNWSHRFLRDDWEEALSAWNAQPVLRSAKIIHRSEKDFCRSTLSRTMNYFSLGRQENLIDQINNLSLPILWLFSNNEAGVVKNLNLKNTRSRLKNMGNVSHRYVFENKLLLGDEVFRFLLTL